MSINQIKISVGNKSIISLQDEVYNLDIDYKVTKEDLQWDFIVFCFKESE